mgnify:CR=1 FL=1
MFKGGILLKADSAISSTSDKHTTSFFIMAKFHLKQFHVSRKEFRETHAM